MRWEQIGETCGSRQGPVTTSRWARIAYVPSTPIARAADTRKECHNIGCAGALEGRRVFGQQAFSSGAANTLGLEFVSGAGGWTARSA